MARQKKSRKIQDIMPARKPDKQQAIDNPVKKKKRDLLNEIARKEKQKKKYKGLPSGNRNNISHKSNQEVTQVPLDPRIGSLKKIALIDEAAIINPAVTSKSVKERDKTAKIDPYDELLQLENNEYLNQLLDEIEAGQKIKAKDQEFVDQCLARIDVLMQQLEINENDDENDDDLYSALEKADINKFR